MKDTHTTAKNDQAEQTDKATRRVMDKVIVIGMSKKQEKAFRGGLERKLTQRPPTR
mgnify:CR=1 FL=1|jgi:hypothetical protein